MNWLDSLKMHGQSNPPGRQAAIRQAESSFQELTSALNEPESVNYYNIHVQYLLNVYCRTANFRDRKISRLWTIGNSRAGKFRKSGARGAS